MFSARDVRGHTLVLPKAPTRIISLVPSDTFSLAVLGLSHTLVGRTDYCVEPVSLAQNIPSVGGTKNPRLGEILARSPDLIIANQEENTQKDIERLEAAGLPVYLSFPKTVAEGFSHLASMAALCGVSGEVLVQQRLAEAHEALREAEAYRQRVAPLRVFVPIWMDPLMTVHGDTFISDVLDLCGAYNVFCDRPRRYPLAADLGKRAPVAAGGRDTRYPRVALDEVEARAPEIVLLPDEPHPFSSEDAAVFGQLKISAAATGKIVFCEGKDLCWAGAQSIEGLGRLRRLIDNLR